MYSLIVYRDVYKVLLKCCNNFSDFNCKKKVLEKTFFSYRKGSVTCSRIFVLLCVIDLFVIF